MRELHRALRVIAGGGRRDALIQHHHDVAADRLLHLDAGFRRQHVRRAIDVAFETRALLVHRAFVRQGENLKSARVGEHRTIPVHEAMNAAELLEHLRARAQQQMIGVGEQHA